MKQISFSREKYIRDEFYFEYLSMEVFHLREKGRNRGGTKRKIPKREYFNTPRFGCLKAMIERARVSSGPTRKNARTFWRGSDRIDGREVTDARRELSGV